MQHKWFAAGPAMAAVLLAANARSEPPAVAKSDAERFRGAWKVVSAQETRGFEKNADVGEYADSIWTFGEREITIVKGKTKTTLAYKLNPAAKVPEIDIRAPGIKPALEGIYKLDGENLTICDTVLNIRPTDFSMGQGIAVIKRLVVLKREPAPKKQ